MRVNISFLHQRLEDEIDERLQVVLKSMREQSVLVDGPQDRTRHCVERSSPCMISFLDRVSQDDRAVPVEENKLPVQRGENIPGTNIAVEDPPGENVLQDIDRFPDYGEEKIHSWKFGQGDDVEGSSEEEDFEVACGRWGEGGGELEGEARAARGGVELRSVGRRGARRRIGVYEVV